MRGHVAKKYHLVGAGKQEYIWWDGKRMLVRLPHTSCGVDLNGPVFAPDFEAFDIEDYSEIRHDGVPLCKLCFREVFVWK